MTMLIVEPFFLCCDELHCSNPSTNSHVPPMVRSRCPLRVFTMWNSVGQGVGPGRPNFQVLGRRSWPNILVHSGGVTLRSLVMLELATNANLVLDIWPQPSPEHLNTRAPGRARPTLARRDFFFGPVLLWPGLIFWEKSKIRKMNKKTLMVEEEQSSMGGDCAWWGGRSGRGSRREGAGGPGWRSGWKARFFRSLRDHWVHLNWKTTHNLLLEFSGHLVKPRPPAWV